MGKSMRIMKTGEPCPCCGQAIPAMLPVDKRLLASVVAEGLAIQDAVRTVEHGGAEGQEAMPTLTPPNEPERASLYGKYTVYKNKDWSLVTNCFVLRPDKDPAAVAALRAYATATDNAELAADIINWVGAETNEPLTLEQLREMSYTDWVWVVFPELPPEENGWIRASQIYRRYSHEHYGKTWIAYRRSPEGEVNA